MVSISANRVLRDRSVNWPCVSKRNPPPATKLVMDFMIYLQHLDYEFIKNRVISPFDDFFFP